MILQRKNNMCLMFDNFGYYRGIIGQNSQKIHHCPTYMHPRRDTYKWQQMISICMIGRDVNGVMQKDIVPARKKYPARGNGKRGKKVSEETRAKMRVSNSRPRGSYVDKLNQIHNLCSQTGFRFNRIRNYWLLYDENKKEYKFRSAQAALDFMVGDGKYSNQIYSLCEETGYQFVRYAIKWAILRRGIREYYGDADGAVRFLKEMKKFLVSHNMLPKHKPGAP